MGKLLFIHVIQVLAGGVAVFTSFQRRPITHRYSEVPLSNQRFWRFAFFVVGVVLILSGLWELWLALHHGR